MTPEQVKWLMGHLKTCHVCEWPGEHDDHLFCDTAARVTAAPAAVEMRKAGAAPLFDVEGAG